MNANAVCLSLIVLLSAGTASAQGKSITEERQALIEYEKAVAELAAANQDITRALQELAQKTEHAANQHHPEKAARDSAEAHYEAAKKALQDIPSMANRKRVEDAKFAFFMADRKYQRATRDVSQLQQQQDELRATLEANRGQIAATTEQTEKQRRLIAAQERQLRQKASKQAASERQQRIAKENALRQREQELDRTRREHAAALAEIEKLKSRLVVGSTGAAAAPAVVRTPIPVAKPSTPAQPPARPAVATDGDSRSLTATLVKGGRKAYYRLLKVAGEDRARARKLQKIMHVKTYHDDRLLKQTSHSLKYLGNDLYEGKSIVRAGRTQFVIGGKQWIQQIPTSAHKDQYVFLLDYRNPATPELLLFARSDIQ